MKKLIAYLLVLVFITAGLPITGWADETAAKAADEYPYDENGLFFEVRFEDKANVEITIHRSSQGKYSEHGMFTGSRGIEIRAIYNGEAMSVGDYMKNVLGHETVYKSHYAYLDDCPPIVAGKALILGGDWPERQEDGSLPAGEYVIYKYVTIHKYGESDKTVLLSESFTVNADGECKLAPLSTYLGDIDSNGEIEASDYARAKRFVLGTYAMSDEELARADVDKDGKVNATDYAMIKRHVLGTYTISVLE